MLIPMQLVRMIAEIQEVLNEQTLLNQPQHILPEDFDMIQLYDHFVNTKYCIYHEKIGINLNFNMVQKILFTKELNKIHIRLAIKVLFPEMEEDFVGNNLLSKEEEQEMNLVGIVQIINGRVVFTHPTFAEYFVSSFLAGKLNKKKSRQKYEVITKFLAKELFESKNEVFKTFLDYHLAKEEINVAAFQGKLEDVRKILSENNANVSTIDNLGRSALHYAAQAEHIEIVDILLKEGMNIRKQDELGKMALHYAARYNHREQVVSCLLKNAKDCMNSKDNNGRTPLYYAAEQGNWDIVDCILTEMGANVEDLNSLLDKEKLLFHYTYKGNLDIIKNLIREENIDVTTIQDNNGNTLLHVAAEKEHWGTVEFLLRKNVRFNHLNDNQKLLLFNYSTENALWSIVKLFIKDTGRDYFSFLNEQQRVELLCHSISFGDFNVVELLMTKDIAINNPDNDGKSPIYYAVRNEYWNIAESLLRKRASLTHLSDVQQLSMLCYSAENSHWDIVKLFMECGHRDNYFDCLSDEQKIHCICYFISIGDFDVTRCFIEKLTEEGKIIVNTPNNCGKTFLHLAAQEGQLNIVKYLVDEKGVNVNAVTSHGSTPLHLSATTGYLEIVKYLVEKGADVYLSDNNNKAAIDIAKDEGHRSIENFLTEFYTLYYKLFFAVRDGSLDTIKHIIEDRNIDINFKYKNGFTLLHMAARRGKYDIVKYLIEKGANFRMKDHYGNTALHWTPFIHEMDVLRFLLPPNDMLRVYTVKGEDQGKPAWHHVLIDKDKKDLFLKKSETGSMDVLDYGEILCSGFGNDPREGIGGLYFTKRKDKLSIIKYLVGAKNDDPNIKNSMGNTVLHLVTAGGFLDALKYLIEEKGADMDLRNDKNSTLLHCATCLDMVDYLVGRGSNISAENKFGNVPLHFSALYGSLDVIKYFVERGARFDVKNNDGETPLHFAAEDNKLDIVKYLIEQGADITDKNKVGKVPKDLAAEKGYTDVVEFLKEAQEEWLLKAAKQGDLDMVRSLINQGANVDCRLLFEYDSSTEVRNNVGMTALHWTAKNGHPVIAKLLADNGANIHAMDDNGRKPIHVAALHGQRDVIELFLSRGVNVDDIDKYGWTPLHYAICNGKSQIVTFLLSSSADMNAPGKNGKTAYDLAKAVVNLQASNQEVNIISPNSLDPYT